ncbi:hypothetical protein Nocox_38080 [Nonomuraea coxensis DSM 45129]|uniref:Integral membrane protein n=1 Tax=Nonomuraea coxensis DSM 45129 TaxID=1122611 RepID=A0ABX8UE03_9ACTN|nr:hypothetical protein [Nonomuraea coxensis]QYC45166.1 hypothetical protein Nocox_38080 [Nonomuraea coxensis DSM 45129]
MSATSPTAGRRHFVLHRWPTALGLAVAILSLVTGSNQESLAITLSVAAVCYLAAAALGEPWTVWPAALGASLVVVVSELIGMSWWAGLGGTAVVLVVVGLALRVSRSALLAQTLAVAGFGGAALIAVFSTPQVGVVVAGLALASHAIWDVIHLRRKLVVAPSLAEACIFLDVPLGLGLIVLAFVS